jgi:hypothetical protein
MDDNYEYNNTSTAALGTMYSTTFGTANFEIRPPKLGNVEDGFPTIPYVPIEAIFFQQQASNPAVATTNVLTGSTAGTQNISGTQTVSDSTGNVRVQIGAGSY